VSKIIFGITLGLVSSFLFQGCGYTLQGSRNELLEKENIRRIYVQPMKNSTFKAGVEHVVYNALIRTLVAGRRVSIVKLPEEADAILIGSIVTAFAAISGSTNMTSLQPGNVFADDKIVVGTIYVATLNCSFSLVRRNVPPGQRATVWSSSFSRTKSYPAAIQLDVPGTTSSLINESEFDRALGDLAGSMMLDLHESMLAMF